MKRILIFCLAAAVMLFTLAACGSNRDDDGTVSGSGSGSVSDTDNGMNDGIDSSVGDREDASTDGLPDNGTISNGTGDAAVNDGHIAGSGSASTTTQRSTLKGATYGQMLRNARVHDTDGNLRDNENPVTPGTAY